MLQKRQLLFVCNCLRASDDPVPEVEIVHCSVYLIFLAEVFEKSPEQWSPQYLFMIRAWCPLEQFLSLSQLHFTHLQKRTDLVFNLFFWVSISNLTLLTIIVHFCYIHIFFPKRHYWFIAYLTWEKETFLFNGTRVLLPHTHMPPKASLNRAVTPGTMQSFSSYG